MKRFNVVIFKADDAGLLLSMVVPISDVDGDNFQFAQEVAIDGVAYDAVAVGQRIGKSLLYEKVNLYPFDGDDKIRECEVVIVKTFNA